MKSLLSILSALLEDASSSLGADTRRDRETILDRIEHEGVAFLHITLPLFGSWLEQSLESGRAVPSIHSTFRRKPKSTKCVLPCFLQGLTRLVFNEETGVERKDASALAVFFIRQICYLYKKPKALASKKRIAKAMKQFVETDSEVPSLSELTHSLHIPTLTNCQSWWNEASQIPPTGPVLIRTSWIAATMSLLLPRFESQYMEARSACFPKHGPGATADKLRGNSKYCVRDWYSRWSDVFFHEELYGNTIELEEDLDVIEPQDELPVKVIAVPKTYKTSRIISIEPTAMQYAQQYVLSKMIHSIEKSSFKGILKLSDQSQNRNLARKGSVGDLPFATIDLSEASDRVGLALVQVLFGYHCPTLTADLLAVRSSRAILPDDKVLSLRKYASMGSATTFPVESVIFAILAVAGTAKTLYEERHGAGVKNFRKSQYHCIRDATTLVSVYGDDIIVPRAAFKEVCQYLEACGLKVNANKSFAQGFFKESCGGDYYKGVDVTPAYCRTEAPGRPADAESLISFVSLSNQLYFKGCWRASEEVKSIVEKIIGELPLKAKRSSYLGWETFRDAVQYEKFDKNFSPIVRAYTVKTKKRSNPLDGNSALLKHFLSRMPQEAKDHLSYDVERHSTRLTRRWLTP